MRSRPEPIEIEPLLRIAPHHGFERADVAFEHGVRGFAVRRLRNVEDEAVTPAAFAHCIVEYRRRPELLGDDEGSRREEGLAAHEGHRRRGAAFDEAVALKADVLPAVEHLLDPQDRLDAALVHGDHLVALLFAVLVHDVFDPPVFGVVHHEVHFAGVVAEEPGPRAPAADVRADDHRAAPAVEQTQESVVILEFELVPVRHAAADGHPVDDGLPQRVIVGIEFDRRAEDAVTEYAAVIEPDGPRGAGCERDEVDDYQREESVRGAYSEHVHQEDEETVSERSAARASAPPFVVICHSSG